MAQLRKKNCVCLIGINSSKWEYLYGALDTEKRASNILQTHKLLTLFASTWCAFKMIFFFVLRWTFALSKLCIWKTNLQRTPNAHLLPPPPWFRPPVVWNYILLCTALYCSKQTVRLKNKHAAHSKCTFLVLRLGWLKSGLILKLGKRGDLRFL